MVFPTFHRSIGIVAYISAAGIIYHYVFVHDFGEKEHCFTWIRKIVETKKKKFFNLDSSIIEQKKAERQFRALTMKTNKENMETFSVK